MLCPYCGIGMTKGKIMTVRLPIRFVEDGAKSFLNLTIPRGVDLTSPELSIFVSPQCVAWHCELCQKIILDVPNQPEAEN